MKKGFMTLAVLSTLSLSAFSQDVEKSSGVTVDGSLTGQTRYMQVNSKDKKMEQYNVTIMGTIDFNGIVQLHGLAQTGNAYNLAYNNIYNSASGKFRDDEHLKLRRLYLSKQMLDGKLVIAVGAMGNRASIARAGKLSDLGWVDGSRAELKTDLGKITVTGGSLNSGEANAFDRAKEFDLNYFEITVSKVMFKKLMVEAGIEVLNDETFLETAAKHEIEIASGRVISLVSDAIINTGTGGVKVGGGIDNLLALFTDKFSTVKVSAAYMYTSADIGQRGQLTNTFTALGAQGHAAIFGVSAPISKKYGITGFATARITPKGNGNLYEVGVKKTLNFGKKKK